MKIDFYLFLMGAFVLLSCGSRTSEESKPDNILENLTVTIDTVMIDSKDQIFDLTRGPYKSSISEDGQQLFFFNSNTSQIQQINLDKLEWEKDFNFEIEGPNGIGDAVFGTKTLGDGTFLITSYNKAGIFDESGIKIKDFSIPLLKSATDLKEIDYALIISKDQKSLFSLPGIRYQGPRTFAKINLQTFEFDNFPIEEMDWIFDIKVGLSTHSFFDEYMYLREFNNQILALSPSSSAFYHYDLDSDSLIYHSFVHELSPVANDVKLKKIVESDKEYKEELRKFYTGINFGSPIWDETRKLYFRFGRKGKLINDDSQISSSQVFMYIYDQAFKLVGEAELPKFSRSPSEPFFKDGKLWSYVNVEDELGFAVMDFKFKDDE